MLLLSFPKDSVLCFVDKDYLRDFKYVLFILIAFIPLVRELLVCFIYMPTMHLETRKKSPQSISANSLGLFWYGLRLKSHLSLDPITYAQSDFSHGAVLTPRASSLIIALS